jgi:hypothetical protein
MFENHLTEWWGGKEVVDEVVQVWVVGRVTAMGGAIIAE